MAGHYPCQKRRSSALRSPHINRLVINHSFNLSGLIGVGTSCLAGYLLAGIYGLI